MTDKYNLEYETCVEMQERDLRIWAKRLRSEIYAGVCHYVRRHNAEAPTAKDRHQVWRGQDLVEIITHWPEPAPTYPPTVEKVGEEFI